MGSPPHIQLIGRPEPECNQFKNSKSHLFCGIATVLTIGWFTFLLIGFMFGLFPFQGDSKPSCDLKGNLVDFSSNLIQELFDQDKKFSTRKRRNLDLLNENAESDIDPLKIDYSFLPGNIRDKRLEEMNYLKDEYRRCKKSQESDCIEIFKKMFKLAKKIEKKITEMKKLFEFFPNEKGIDSDSDSSEEKTSAPIPLELNTESPVKTVELTSKKSVELIPLPHDKAKLKVVLRPQTATTTEKSPGAASQNSTDDVTLTTSTTTATESSSIDLTTTLTIIKPTELNVTTEHPKSDENKIDDSDKILSKFKSGYVTIHEDLKGPSSDGTTFLRMEDSERSKVYSSTKLSLNNSELIEEMDVNPRSSESPKSNPLGQPQIASVSGPFLSVCEKILKDHPHLLNRPGHSQPNFNGFTSTGHQAHQFSSKGQIDETIKASAHVMYNPNIGFAQAPICFFAPQGNFRGQSMQIWTPPQYQIPGLNTGPLSYNQAGLIYVPPMLGVYNNPGNFHPYGHTTSGGGGIINQVIHNSNRNHSPANLSPYFCTYMPNTTPQWPGRFRSPAENPTKPSADAGQKDNIPTKADIIYATYVNASALHNDIFPSHRAPEGMISCKSATPQYIPKDKWCDSYVDCDDASDELACSCKSRLARTKICDGYADCPMSEDEVGCFGCRKSMTSCYNNEDEYIKANNSTEGMCYSQTNKCDGVYDCLNGNDERDCNLLVGYMDHHLVYSAQFTEGILHRNYRGKWYPVCKNPLKWAKQACESELGAPLESDPTISYQNANVYGPFIQSKNSNARDLSDPEFPDSCPHTENDGYDSMVHVKCPPIKCGRRLSKPLQTFVRIRKSTSANSREDILLKPQSYRVVGGLASDPLAWPFVVALYKDGHFHCGAIIYNENWAITAAHCVYGFQHHYYEMKVGMLRKHSFSPMTQILKVSRIVIHDEYDRRKMQNDISLLRAESPFQFNRWVRPICMPSKGRSSTKDDWIWGPEPETICTAVGWGAIRERGPDADHLREVTVPVLQRCKHKADQEGEELCAGELLGGHDACQGDSGGPIFCKSVSDEKEWYLGGVVSHGEGCARPDEPGAYTRVALFLDWIHNKTTSNYTDFPAPTMICTGHVCMWGGQKCIPRRDRCNRIVDCLGGEDEIGCVYPNERDEVGIQRDMEAVEPDPKDASKTLFDVINKKNQTIHGHFEKPDPHDSNTADHLSGHSEKHKRQNSTTHNTHHNSGQEFHSSHSKNSTHSHQISNTSNALHSANSSHSTKNQTSHDQQEKFICKKIPQKINLSQKCDRINDCEDGTDEKHCSCRDFLKGSLKELICDGRVDCTDFSDEKDCGNCTHHEFLCPLSGTCINKTQRCDEKIDCHFKEDEQDCFTLSDGNKIFLDTEFRPSLQSAGLFSRNINGVWNLVCINATNYHKEGTETTSKVCNLLGFSGYKSYNTTTLSKFNPLILQDVPVTKLRHSVFNKHLLTYFESSPDIPAEPYLNSENSPRFRHVIADPRTSVAEEPVISSNNECDALFVECIPHSNHGFQQSQEKLQNISKDDKKPKDKKDDKSIKKSNSKTFDLPDILKPKPIQSDSVDIHLPWLVSLHVDGNLQCHGVLLDKDWVLASSYCSGQYLSLRESYIVAVLGRSKASQNISITDEQIRRVDCVKIVRASHVALFHLEKYAKYTRHVLPTFIPDSNISNSKSKPECMAISSDDFGRIKTSPVHETKCHLNKLDAQQSCYQRINVTGEPHFDMKLNSKAHHNCHRGTDNGIIMCKEHKTGWYPVSFYLNNTENCNFEKKLQVQILKHNYESIQHILDYSHCDEIYYPLVCPTKRCPLGNCLPHEKVCNGVVDCHDGSDENTESCHMKKGCSASELRCHNGKCVSKTKFCDHINDCGDLTDEPSECSCLTYLKATDPSKICDGIRNCWDKSDENPLLCKCTEYSFRCGSSNLCVPRDFVCDKETDCPESEDEKYCYGIEHPPNHSDGYGQVIQQSYGIWHTKCYPRNNPPNDTEVQDICHKLGYSNVYHDSHPLRKNNTKPSYRFLSDTQQDVEGRSISEGHNESQSASSSSEEDIFAGGYRAATKAVVINKFSPLRLNNELTLYLKPSRPIAELVKWDASDQSHCHRLEIKCQ